MNQPPTNQTIPTIPKEDDLFCNKTKQYSSEVIDEDSLLDK
jgi:hypothetical protein